MPLKIIEEGVVFDISISTQILETERRDLLRLFWSRAIVFPIKLPINFRISEQIYSMGRWGREIHIVVKRAEQLGVKLAFYIRINKGYLSKNQGQVVKILNR